jgi:hypothetical protein
MNLSRRSLLGVGAALICAPAIAATPLPSTGLRFVFTREYGEWWMTIPEHGFFADWDRAWEIFAEEIEAHPGMDKWEVLLPTPSQTERSVA